MHKPGNGNQIPLAEWIASAVGFVLVSATVLFLAHEGVTGSTAPPAISVRITSEQSVPQGYVVVFDVLNAGGTTAADVEIEGALMNGSQAVEVSSLTLPYVPPGSRRRGGLFFRHDPREGRLELRAKGYREP